MTATVYVQPETDTLVIDVTGAKPEEQQTAELKLWAPRAPRAAAKGQVGVLSEAWTDDKEPESSGRTLGSLSAITAQGRNVTVKVRCWSSASAIPMENSATRMRFPRLPKVSTDCEYSAP